MGAINLDWHGCRLGHRPIGAVVAGATVTLTDTATNIARPANTNATGRYIYVDVNPGIYSITVSKAGFADHED